MDPGLRAAGLFFLNDGTGEEIDARLLHVKFHETPVPLVDVRDSLPQKKTRQNKKREGKNEEENRVLSCPYPL